MAAPQIPLKQILAAMDRKDRNFYNNLDDELKKKFSPFMMLKYVSTLGPPNNYNRELPMPAPDMEQYYIFATNRYANKYMLEISNKEHQHQQLQWLLLTTVSPGMGDQSHVYIKVKPKPKNTSAPIKKQLLELFPIMKEDDVDALAAITSKKELNQYIKDHGQA